MRSNKDFIISFSGLSLGLHEFDIDVDSSLFESYGNEDIVDADVALKVVLTKEERMMSFNISFKGTLSVLCDRCLESMQIDIEGESNLYVKFGDEYLEEDEDLIVVPHQEHKIDLSSYIYDCLLLQKPMQCVHQGGECNEDMLKILEEITENENKESIDPRWEALKNINIE